MGKCFVWRWERIEHVVATGCIPRERSVGVRFEVLTNASANGDEITSNDGDGVIDSSGDGEKLVMVVIVRVCVARFDGR